MEDANLDMFTGALAYSIGRDNPTAVVESLDFIGEITVKFPNGKKFVIEIEEDDSEDTADDGEDND